MDEVLRRSATHMLTPDINDPLLSDDALHHLNRVLRLREGESVTVTNGNGEWRHCLWTGTGLEIAGEIHHEPARDNLEISVAIPKGDRLEWMVQKLVELGVDLERSQYKYFSNLHNLVVDASQSLGSPAGWA